MMLVEHGFTLFVLAFGAFALLVIPFTLVLHVLMPKTILDKYFKPPFFGEFERAMFTGIPYGPMRTIMFMGVIVFPSLGRKRNLTRMHEDVPTWYRRAAAVCLYAYFVTFGGGMLILFLIGGLALYVD